MSQQNQTLSRSVPLSIVFVYTCPSASLFFHFTDSKLKNEHILGRLMLTDEQDNAPGGTIVGVHPPSHYDLH